MTPRHDDNRREVAAMLARQVWVRLITRSEAFKRAAEMDVPFCALIREIDLIDVQGVA